jgi:hypothetical protein
MSKTLITDLATVRPMTRPARTNKDRAVYLTLEQAAEAYPVFTFRLLRRLVEERRIAFSRAGRRIVLNERDIEQYLEANRVEPWQDKGLPVPSDIHRRGAHR